MDNLISLWASSGLAQMQSGQFIMMIVGLVLLYLAINKGFEPLLLLMKTDMLTKTIQS